jgi:hypothetical protein
MYVRVCTQALQFFFYLLFFCMVFISYGLPLHIVRDLWNSYSNLRTRLQAYNRYRYDSMYKCQSKPIIYRYTLKVCYRGLVHLRIVRALLDVSALYVLCINIITATLARLCTYTFWICCDALSCKPTLLLLLLVLYDNRQLTANMNERFPDATPEELDACEHTCIICR